MQVPLGGNTYGEECVFIANDWHTALVPTLLGAKYRPGGVYLGARSVLAIHNLFHQGVFPPDTFGNLNLPDHCAWPAPCAPAFLPSLARSCVWPNVRPWMTRASTCAGYNNLGYQFMERAHMACYSYGHAINYLKAAITAADRLVTVRPGHHCSWHAIR